MPCIGVTLYHPIVTPPLQGCAGLERRSRAAGAAFSLGRVGLQARASARALCAICASAPRAVADRNRPSSFFAKNWRG